MMTLPPMPMNEDRERHVCMQFIWSAQEVHPCREVTLPGSAHQLRASSLQHQPDGTMADTFRARSLTGTDTRESSATYGGGQQDDAVVCQGIDKPDELEAERCDC